jgi:spermidine/putrescine-binding protein
LLLFVLQIFLPTAVLADGDILRLLVWEGYTPEKYIADFEREIERRHGRRVKLAVSYAESPDDFFHSIRNQSVDLVTISHHTIKDERFHFIDKGLILPFEIKNIPDHRNIIPDLQKADFHFSNGKIYGIPVANGPYGLAYNTKSFQQAPQSWNVFWDPAFKNKYVIGAHEYIYNVNITALVMGYPRSQISSFDALNNIQFRKKLRQLAMNANSLWVGVDKPEDLMGMSIAASWGDSLSALKRRGEIWKMAVPKEGTIWWVDEYAMTLALKDKPFLKRVAEEWINRSLSPDFQIDHLIREVGIFPVITNIADNLTPQ